MPSERQHTTSTRLLHIHWVVVGTLDFCVCVCVSMRPRLMPILCARARAQGAECRAGGWATTLLPQSHPHTHTHTNLHPRPVPPLNLSQCCWLTMIRSTHRGCAMVIFRHAQMTRTVRVLGPNRTSEPPPVATKSNSHGLNYYACTLGGITPNLAA